MSYHIRKKTVLFDVTEYIFSRCYEHNVVGNVGGAAADCQSSLPCSLLQFSHHVSENGAEELQRMGTPLHDLLFTLAVSWNYS